MNSAAGTLLRIISLVVISFHTLDVAGDRNMHDAQEAAWVPAGHDERSDTGLEGKLVFTGSDAVPTQMPRQQRLAELEDALRPSVALMPTNGHGNLELPSVHYVMHRFFLWRHGWFIKSIGPMGDAWNDSAPGDIFEDAEMPAQVKGMFEKRLGWQGLGLHDIAVVTATLEDLIRGQAVDGLRHAYRRLGLDFKDGASVPATVAENAILMYMAFHIVGSSVATETDAYAKELLNSMPQVYPSWPRFLEYVKGLRKQFTANAQSLNTSTTKDLLVYIGDKHPDFQDNDHCHKIKRHLIGIEDPGTGRVPLSRFYGDMARQGMWQFSESPSYLKQLGALDNETVPGQPSVVIPNYVSGLSNCLATSKYHWLCCRSECEPLVRHIEKEVGTADAEARQIVAAVRSLPPHLVPTTGSLAEPLVERLLSVADANGGKIPLQGRLFSQWMHHAFPHECPYPHVSGTTSPLVPNDFEQEASGQVMVSAKEVNSAINTADGASANTRHATKDQLPWSDVEELVVHRPSVMTHAELAEDKHVWRAVTAMGALSTFAAFSLVLMRTTRRVSQAVAILSEPGKVQHKLSEV